MPFRCGAKPTHSQQHTVATMMDRQHSCESSWDSFFVRMRKRATREARKPKKIKRKEVPMISGGKVVGIRGLSGRGCRL